MALYFKIFWLFWWRGDQFVFDYNEYYPCSVTDEFLEYHKGKAYEKRKVLIMKSIINYKEHPVVKDYLKYDEEHRIKLY